MNDDVFLLEDEVNLRIILIDLAKNSWLIILAVLTVYVGSFVYKGMIYSPEYTTTATFVVSAKNSGYTMNIYSSLSTASDMASVFREVFCSNVLKRIVLEQLGDPNIDFLISADVIADTNLLKLSVTSTTPKLSYSVMQTVIGHYDQVSEYLFGYAVLDILQSPGISTKPSNSLDIHKIQVLGGCLAAVFMTALIVFFSVTRSTIKTKDGALHQLGEYPLVVIPRDKKDLSIWKVLSGKKKSLLITNSIIGFHYVEAVHKLAYKVSHRMKHKKQKVLLVTGVGINEGKSTVSANLALALAENDQKVVIVDMDLRRAAIHKIFENKSNSIELAECLKDPDILPEIENGEMLMIFNREVKGKPSELIQSKEMERFIAHLRSLADFIILDSAPLAMVADSELLTEHADATILVVQQDETPAEAIRTAMSELNQSHSELIGYVLNNYRESFRFGESLYGYGQRYERKDNSPDR